MKTGIIMPGAWTEPTKQVTSATNVAARVDMSAEVAGQGLCPVCKKQTEIGFADGARVRFCRNDLVTLPLTNEEIADLDNKDGTPEGGWQMPEHGDTYGDAFN